MPTTKNVTPKYRLYRKSGQAVVTLRDHVTKVRRDFLLGPYASEISRKRYDETIAEWLANGRRLAGQPVAHPTATVGITMTEIMAAFLLHIRENLPSELSLTKCSLRYLKRVAARDPAVAFGPNRLRQLRDEMLRDGKSRPMINRQIKRIVAMMKWAASYEMIAFEIYDRLRTVEPLKRGKTSAYEPPPVEPVTDAEVDAIKPFVSRQVWALIELQRRTGARAGELVDLRPVDIDMSKPIWVVDLKHHKTAHRGHRRRLWICERAKQAILPFLANRPLNAYLFSPIEAEAERRADLHAKRRTPLSYGNRPGSNRKEDPKRAPADHYTVASYRRAIHRACDLAFQPPREIKVDPAALQQWQSEHRWSPHQLRHAAATRIRAESDLETAKILLGHSDIAMTEHYAREDDRKAVEIMRRIG